MSFDKYRQSESAFSMYYDEFLKNSMFGGRRYRITLADGSVAEGVPTTGSLVPRDISQATFRFRMDDGTTYQIPFTDLARAEAL